MRERTVSVRAVAIGWALVACGMAQAENLGRIGPTYPIAEQNLLDHIMTRLREKERSGELAKFEQLARANSTDAGSKDKGGDLNWFTPEAMTPPFAEAVQKLKKGETTAAPVKTEFGWHVIRLTDTADNPPPPFESVKDRLGQMVQEKKFSAYVDTLLAKAKVTKTP